MPGLNSRRWLGPALPGALALASAHLLGSCGHGGSTFIPGDAAAGVGGASAGSANAGGANAAGNAGSAGMSGNAGSAGSGGNAGSPGTGGDAGSVSTGGDAGSAGSAGDAGSAGTGGDAGSAGVGGNAGSAGAGGNGGAGGSAGSAGDGGSAGVPQGPVTEIFGEVPGAHHVGVTTDTKIRGDNVTTQSYDYGGGWFFGPDANPITHALLRFNVSAIPTNAVVISATLELWTGTCSNCQGNSNTAIDVYRLAESWTEGPYDSEYMVMAGFCNWNYRSSGTPWSAPGAEPPSRSAGPSARFYPLALDTKYSVAVSTLVQDWVSTPATNHGMLLRMDDPAVTDGVAFVSSESTEFANSTTKRPRLIVQYQMP